MSHYGEPLINDVLINHIHSGMKLLYKESYELNKNDPIIVFQVALSKIKDISQTNLEEEYNRLLQRVENHGNDEEFIERMFELIYRNTTKYLMETEKGYIVDNVHEIPLQNLNISSNKYKTLHLFTLESARGLYTKANLYYDGYSKEDQEKNYEQTKHIIRNSIIKCVKRRVNLNALYDYFEEKYNEESSSSSEEEIIDYHDHIMEQNLELQESRPVESLSHQDHELPLMTGGHNLQENYDSDSSSIDEEDENQKEEQMHEVSSEDDEDEREEHREESDNKDETDNQEESYNKDEIKKDEEIKDETKDEEENDFKIIKVQESSSSSEEELKKEDDIKHIKLVYNQSEDSESEKDDSEEEKSIISNSSQDSIDIKDIINELKE